MKMQNNNIYIVKYDRCQWEFDYKQKALDFIDKILNAQGDMVLKITKKDGGADDMD